MSRYGAVLDPGREHDLGRVILGSELAGKIESTLSSTFSELRGSDYCAAGSSDPATSLVATAWRDHGPLIFVAGALALALLLTPFALKRLDAPQWSRVLVYSIKAMVTIGLLAYVFHRAGAAVDHANERNELCDESGWNELQKDPASLPKRADLIMRFKKRVEAIEANRAARLDQAIDQGN